MKGSIIPQLIINQPSFISDIHENPYIFMVKSHLNCYNHQPTKDCSVVIFSGKPLADHLVPSGLKATKSASFYGLESRKNEVIPQEKYHKYLLRKSQSVSHDTIDLQIEPRCFHGIHVFSKLGLVVFHVRSRRLKRSHRSNASRAKSRGWGKRFSKKIILQS